MALLLYAEKLRITFGLRTVFEIKSIEIHDGDQIGLVGQNGAGKSTLLSVLHGEREPDEGFIKRFSKSAMIRQFGNAEETEMDRSIQARLRAKDTVYQGISGGELERLRIARALSVHAPLLFVDEPTTNLDFDGVAQVKNALLSHQGALVLVSHDRMLLDSLCTQIWELSEGTLKIFPGNYTQFQQQKAMELDYQRFQYEQYRTEQKRLRTAIHEISQASNQVHKAPSRMGNSEARLHKRGKATTAKKKLDRAASSLQSRLENMKDVERPQKEARIQMGLSSRGGIASAFALRAEHLTIAVEGKALLQDASFSLPTGKRTVLVGPNGCGKTTLLRAIRDEIPGIRLSPGVSIGWFGQETADTLDPSLTLLQNVTSDNKLPLSATRTMLARIGLSASDIDKPVSVLSGGERVKAALVRLMTSDASLLLLDEPSNYLDIPALEALEEMLAAYEGTLLLVSHDRHMIDRVAHRLLLFERGMLHSFEGNLSEYEARAMRSTAQDDAMEEDILRMRMSALAARIAAPRKGDNPESLIAEYEEMAKQLRNFQTSNAGRGK